MYMNRLNWVERVMEAAHIPIGQLCTRLTKTSPRPRDSSHLPFRPVRLHCELMLLQNGFTAKTVSGGMLSLARNNYLLGYK